MKHNIFISYAWVDNEVYAGAEKGWVQVFVDNLRKHLARELGRRDEADSLWVDYEQIRGNQGLTPTIRAHLEASHTLVLILSKGYLASPWCRQELEAFVETAGADSGRIFVVQMAPLDREPEPLQDLLKYSFWYLDDNREPCTRWFPDIDPPDREYPRQQQRLARDLAAKLQELETRPEPSSAAGTGHAGRPAPEREPTPDQGPTPDQEREPAPKPPPPRPSPGAESRFILVNGGAEDKDLVNAIAKRLGQLNLDVAVPLSVFADQARVKSSTLSRDLRDKLSLCDSVLMVYRKGPVDQVSQHLVECLKSCAKTPKGRTPPTIDLCQTQPDTLALGLRTRDMRIHVVGEACADECVEWFLDEIAS
jgi:hypothetical protein